MRPAHILPLFLILAVATGCKNKAHVFYSQTDVARHGLKGKVRSIAVYSCSLDSAAEYCSVMRRKYNEQGFITETIDTNSARDLTMCYKFFYNGDGLLVKQVFTSKVFLAPGEPQYHLAPWEETYEYSFPERKRTSVFREDRNGDISSDTTITLYDKNGNEIQSSDRTSKSFKEYDEHGFLVLYKSIYYAHVQDTFKTSYTNDAKGRPVMVTRSDDLIQTLVYDKDGNKIQAKTYDSTWKKIGSGYTGYCGFDEKGNCLKSITFSPQAKSMYLDSMIIEYY